MNKIKYILYITGVLASYDGHSQPTKPNIIVINCDDMGYGDLSCFGSPTIKTPNIDRMAIEGQKWSSFYVSASVSSPSRAGLLTGRLGVRTGMYGDQRRVLFPDSKGGLPSEELTIAELLKQAGYHIQEEATTKKIYDYAACYYPEGILNPHELFLFQHEDVEFVYFVGMQDSEEFSFRDFLIGKLKEKGMLET